MRYFNTSGPNIVRQHYTLMRTDLMNAGRLAVHRERYFTIWAPRQTGKSTYFRLLADVLEKEGYQVAFVNFENYKEATLAAFLAHLHFHLSTYWGVDYSPILPMQKRLNCWGNTRPKPASCFTLR